MSVAAGDRVGRYALIRTVGAGAMGEVWEAHDPELDRRIAVKLLAPSAASRARLVREARALAKLADRNVVAVYDAGDDDGQVWIAMELVDGGNLRGWLAKPRPWREVVAAFVAAGRGLAAAHRAGLVHRDFKPENVLVRGDGTIVVGDFGLARAGGDGNDGSGVGVGVRRGSSSELTVRGAGASDSQIGGAPTEVEGTAPGSVAGTPPYMAPEQHLGRDVDARADQFGLAVALWEAVYGQRPFVVDAARAADPDAWSVAIINDRRRPPPADTRAPRWLRRVLDRALTIDRERRFPSMDAMVGALDRGLARRRRAAIGGGAMIALGATAAITMLLGAGSTAPPPCRDAAAQMKGVWDPPRRAAIEAAFTATRAGFARDAFARIAADLDARRDAWIAMHTEACEATAVHRAQSDLMLDLRMRCLELRRVELRGMVDALSRIDAADLARAHDAVAALPPIAACADTDALARRRPLPVEPAARVRVDALTADLIAARGRGLLGHYDEAIAAGDRIATQAAALRQDWLVGQARWIEGYNAQLGGDLARARTALEAATRAAADAADDQTAADAWAALVAVVADSRDLPAARALIGAADAAIRRDHDRAEPRQDLMQAEGWLAAMEGELPRAHTIFTDALAHARRTLADRPTAIAAALGNLARVEAQQGNGPAAVAHYGEALALIEHEQGKQHPLYAKGLADLARAQRMAGDAAGALASLDAAVAALEAAYGPDNLQLAPVLVTLGNARAQTGDVRGGLAALERAVAIDERAGDAQLAVSLTALANVRGVAGDDAGAIAALERALPLLERRVGKDSLEYAQAEALYGSQIGCNAGRDRLAHATDVFATQLGEHHPQVASLRAGLAECDRDARRTTGR